MKYILLGKFYDTYIVAWVPRAYRDEGYSDKVFIVFTGAFGIACMSNRGPVILPRPVPGSAYSLAEIHKVMNKEVKREVAEHE